MPVSESFKFAAQAATAVPSLCRGHCQYANYTAKTLSRMLVILALPLVTAPSGPRRPRTFVASVLQITYSDHDIHWQDHRRAVAARVGAAAAPGPEVGARHWHFKFESGWQCGAPPGQRPPREARCGCAAWLPMVRPGTLTVTAAASLGSGAWSGAAAQPDNRVTATVGSAKRRRPGG